MIGLKHLDQRAHHARGRVELARQFAFLFGEFGEAIFIGATEDVLFAAVFDHLNVGKQIDYITQAALVQFWAGEILRQDVLEPFVFLFDAAHGVVYHRADFGGCAPWRQSRSSGQ